jgi:hypothetical protein
VEERPPNELERWGVAVGRRRGHGREEFDARRWNKIEQTVFFFITSGRWVII